MPGERETMKRIRAAVAAGILGETLTPSAVNGALGIGYAGVFLPKHRVGNPGGFTAHFVRTRRGEYRLL